MKTEESNAARVECCSLKKHVENLPRSQQSSKKVSATMINQCAINRYKECGTSSILVAICTLLTIQSTYQAIQASHINQQHQLETSQSNLHLQLHHKSPRYNHQQASVATTLIRPIECRNANNQSELGICMFSIDCMHNKGVALSVCKHNYFVGTCCRLPDHNNFVGIVYDLRDTDYGYLLEARKVSHSAAQSTSSSDHEILSSTQKTSSGSPSSTIIAENRVTSKLEASESSAAPADLGAHTLSDFSMVSPIKSDEKYVISSSSLFTSSSPGQQDSVVTYLPSSLSPNPYTTRTTLADPTPSTSRSSSTSSLSLQEDLNHKDSSFLQEQSYSLSQNKLQQSSQQQSFDVNSIANQLQASRAEPAAASFLDHPPSSAPLALGLASNTTSYDVIGSLPSSSSSSSSTTTTTSESNIQNSELDIVANMGSAHSASSKSTSIGHQFTSDNHTSPSTSDDLHSTKADAGQLTSTSFASSFSIGVAPSSSPSQLMSLISTVPAAAISNDSASSNQEFTVASLPQQTQSVSTSAASGQLVDLVLSSEKISGSESSTEPQVQTTTPFTTSLSTAQIPNLAGQQQDQNLYSSSLTPYSPTTSSSSSQSFDNSNVTQPTSTSSSVDLGSSSATGAEQSTSTTTQQQQTSTQQTVNKLHNDNTSNLPTSSSQQPNQQFWVSSSTPSFPQAAHTQKPASYHYPSGGGAAPFGYGQLYTSHHLSHAPTGSVGGGLHKGLPSSNGINYHPYQPASGLVASTKTVSPSQPGNNLIPNLSHLQSAILSHIPFKLASGLSSGITSYLTAAMKPNGGRPLLASNTAVAHQFGQGNNTNKQGNSSAIRFQPASSSTTTITTTTSTTAPSPSLRPEQHSVVTQSQASSGNATSSVDKNQAIATTQQPATNSSTTTTNHSSLHANNNSIAHLMGWPLQSLISASANHFGHVSAMPSSRDAALQVCGRPQVGPAALGPYSSSQAAALAISSNAEAKKRVARIVGGNQSTFGQWPWIVSLRQWRKGAFLHKCGAALLNDQWAITAAHCVESVKPSDLLLRLGEFDVSNQNEPYPYVERRVKTIVAHPLFDPKTFEYDLALLKFAEPIRYERNILPVCVPSGNDSYVDRIATVIGWGRLYEDGPLPDIIQHVDVPIITNQECEHMYKKAGFVEEIPDIFICAGITKGGRDSCEGDSGGPLTMVDNDGRAYLVGIISWGIGCALPSQPGVYTRITTFSGWINDIVNT